MSETELYESIVTEFPSIWPVQPEWDWANLHDGNLPLLRVIDEMLARYIETPEVFVVVHAEPGVAYHTTRENAVDYIAAHLLKFEIQVADLKFSKFISVSKIGVATGDA
jgi:hypothetical protein